MELSFRRRWCCDTPTRVTVLREPELVSGGTYYLGLRWVERMIRLESLTLELVKPAPGFLVCAVGDNENSLFGPCLG